MKIFVTGATGFVGSHFVQQAIQAGHQVVAIRRTGSTTKIPLGNEPEWIEGGLDGDFEKHLAGIDVFVHLASHTPNPPYDKLSRCLYWNVFASIDLAEQAYGAGVRKFLIAGSCFEYGSAAESVEFLSTNTPLQPTLSYPISKAAASDAFEGFAREHNVALKLLRIFQVYGEGEGEKRMWPSLRRAALSGEDFPMSQGEQIRDFVSVQDVARQFIAHLDFSGTQEGQPVVFHVASGEYQSLLSFAQEWWSFWRATGKIIPGAMPYRKNEIMKLIPEGSKPKAPKGLGG